MPKHESRPPSSSRGLSFRKRSGKRSGTLLAGLALVIFGIAAYSNSFRGPFIFDDHAAIPENPQIRKPASIWQAAWSPKNTTAAGRPVLSLTLALNHALGERWGGPGGGLRVEGYHAFNLAVHLVAGLLLFGVLRRTLTGTELRERFGQHATALSAAVALLWMVHPLQTESVTYIVQRAESLAGLFLLLTLYGAIRAMNLGGQETGSRWWAVLSALACLAGVASKEVVAMAPLLVLLYDWLFVSGGPFRALAAHRKFYLALAASWIALAALLFTNPRGQSVRWDYAEVTSLNYALTQGTAIVTYLKRVFWPADLCFDYGWWTAPRPGEILPASAVVLALLGATAYALYRVTRMRPGQSRPSAGWAGLSFLGAWFFLLLAPSSSVIPVVTEPVAEHRMYLPLAAVVAFVVLGGYALAIGAPRPGVRDTGLRGTLGGPVVGAAVLILAVLLTIRTYQRNVDYRDELKMWTDVVAKRPESARAWNTLGYALELAGRLDEAIPCYAKALQLSPGYGLAMSNLGSALCTKGKLDEGIELLQMAVRDRPWYAPAWHNLGANLARRGQRPEAISALETAARLNPDLALTPFTLGMIYIEQGQIELAEQHFRRAVELKPNEVRYRLHLATPLRMQGRIREARECLEEAVRLDPKDGPALNDLAWLLATCPQAEYRDGTRAVDLARRACSLIETDAAGREAEQSIAWDTLGAALAEAGRFNEASDATGKAIPLARASGHPDWAADFERRLALYRQGKPFREER